MFSFEGGEMSESHQMTGEVQGDALPSGRVGARVVVSLTGTPGPRWSQVLTAHLTQDLTGHRAVGHLHVSDVVQGRALVLEGVEDREAAALGRCLRHAVELANHACQDDPAPCETNMSPQEAQAIAHDVEQELGVQVRDVATAEVR
jgi:hypothetical protein